MLLMDLIHLSNKDLWKILWSVKFFRVNFLQLISLFMMLHLDTTRLIEQKLTFILNNNSLHLMNLVIKQLLIKDMRLKNAKKKIIKPIMPKVIMLGLYLLLDKGIIHTVLMIQIFHFIYTEI